MSQIQWFPGHMLKTQKSIEAILPSIDLVIQILDARAPYSTHNPLLERIAKNKLTLYIINKKDLSQQENLQEWLSFFKEKPLSQSIAISLDSSPNRQKYAKQAKAKIYEMLEKPIQKKGKARVLITGIPNAGKSSFINSLTGKKSANVAKKAGLTQSLQTYQFPHFSLIDTPGLLWHKWDERTGYILAILGSITDRILDFFPISKYAFELLSTKNKGFENCVLGQTTNGNFDDFISLLAKKRGLLLKGGEPDIETACFLFIKDIREGKWGSLILEVPSDVQNHPKS